MPQFSFTLDRFYDKAFLYESPLCLVLNLRGEREKRFIMSVKHVDEKRERERGRRQVERDGKAGEKEREMNNR